MSVGTDFIFEHIPVALHIIALERYGKKAEYFYACLVPADSKQEAMDKGRRVLNPSTIEILVWVDCLPNPAHIDYQKRLLEYRKKH